MCLCVSAGLSEQTAFSGGESGRDGKLKVKRTASLALYQDRRRPRVSLSATPRLPAHSGFTVTHSTARVERLAASSEHKYT